MKNLLRREIFEEPPVLSNNSSDLSFLWLELTDFCNLNCVHCYAESSPNKALVGKLSGEDWKRIIVEAEEMGCRRIQFIGGEPTAYPYFRELLLFAHQRSFESIEVFTNASKVTDQHISDFQKFGTRVATSFYSHQAHIHDQITRNSGSFGRTVAGISKLLAAGINVRVELIRMETNRGDVKRAKQLLEALGVSRIGIHRLQKVGREGTSIKLGSIGDLCGNCWKGKLCVTADGKAFPCIMARNLPVGDVTNESLHEIVTSSSLEATRKKVRDHFSPVRAACGPDEEVCGPDDCGPDAPCGPDPGCGPDDDCGPRDDCGPDVCAPDYD